MSDGTELSSGALESKVAHVALAVWCWFRDWWHRPRPESVRFGQGQYGRTLTNELWKDG